MPATTTRQRTASLREAADLMRKVDDLTGSVGFDPFIRVLEDMADELETEPEDDLGPARLREIQEHIEAAGLA